MNVNGPQSLKVTHYPTFLGFFEFQPGPRGIYYPKNKNGGNLYILADLLEKLFCGKPMGFWCLLRSQHYTT